MPFEYDVSHHAIEGVPGARANDRYVQSAVERARGRGVDGLTPYLLPPTRRNYLREPGDMRGVLSVFGEPEWLPMVTTIAQLWTPLPHLDVQR